MLISNPGSLDERAAIARHRRNTLISQPAARSGVQRRGLDHCRGRFIPVARVKRSTTYRICGRSSPRVVDEDVRDLNGMSRSRGLDGRLIVRKDGNDLSVDLDSLTVRPALRRRHKRHAVGTSGVGSTMRNGAGVDWRDKDTATYIGGGALLGTVIGGDHRRRKGRGHRCGGWRGRGCGAQIYTTASGERTAESLLTFKLDGDLRSAVADTGLHANGSHYHRY